MKNKVNAWIEANFHIDKITIEDFPLFPQGKRIIDANGEEMLVYYDFLHDKVDYTFPKIKKIKEEFCNDKNL